MRLKGTDYYAEGMGIPTSAHELRHKHGEITATRREGEHTKVEFVGPVAEHFLEMFNDMMHLSGQLKGHPLEWDVLRAREESAKAYEEMRLMQIKLREYEGQGGTINMERSWKSKYRNALMEANQRLIDAGLEPVRIRKGDRALDSNPCAEEFTLFDMDTPCEDCGE